MPQRTQHIGNHAQYTPLFHFFASPLAIAFLVWAVARVVHESSTDRWFALLGAVALFAGTAVGRTQALRVQDRLIRLEERMRLARLLPADLHGQIDSIRPSHLIALRFASDAETPELVRYVLANPGVSPKEIKQRVKDWRADWFRA